MYSDESDKQQRITAKLIGQCVESDGLWTRAEAMDLLGSMRAEQAIPVLTRNLDFSPELEEDLKTGRIRSWRSEYTKNTDYYPAFRALVAIGQPSVLPLLAVLRDERFGSRTILAFHALDEILGDTGLLQLLQAEVGKSGSDEVRERLRQYLKVMEDTKRNR